MIGKAHLAAEVLNGRLDGRIISGPQGEQVVLLTNMGKQVIAATIETAERERGVVAKAQEIDNPLLGVLDLASGETSYYQGDAVFTFLDDWLPILATPDPGAAPAALRPEQRRGLDVAGGRTSNTYESVRQGKKETYCLW